MARGKHRKSKQGRDLQDLHDDLASIEAEVANEERLHRDALIAQAEANALKSQLAAACKDRDQACQAEVGRLTNEIAALAPWVAAAREMDRRLFVPWDKTTLPVNDALGGGIEGFEAFVSILDAGDLTVINQGVARRKDMSREKVAAIQKVRGERRTSRPLQHYSDEQTRMRRDLLASRCPADDLRGRSLEDADELEIRAGSVHDHGANSISAWHPAPWIAEPAGESLSTAMLGLILTEMRTDFPDSVEIPPQPQGTLTAATRNALGGLPPRQVISEWRPVYEAAAERAAKSRITLPVKAMPRHPIPADAAALQHWYAAAGWGTALRHEGGPGSSAQSRIAIATQCAVPFWLPPGHTMNYADSEPLSADDLADIRLPFPQVFLALADPLRLDPVAGASPELDVSWSWLTRTVSDMLGRGQGRGLASMLSAGTQGFTTDRVNLAALIEHRGARIEGVVLLADAAGRLDDEFAWCLTVPAKSGGVLGRWTLPASLARTEFRDQIVNLAAVTAWGDWHSPAAVTTQAREHVDGAVNEEPRVGEVPPVHVLNVKATSRSESGSDAGSGTPVAPHIRRGHWRRQRYGPKRSLEKRVRIAPVLVNAARGDIGPRVYRLPVEAAGGR
ncbi:hypothetical protein [Prescottella equi]|uniref:hypothetical protein n=1 Tax=Rhodococcus hoagii TaxID=43767 RepID=UPI001EE9C748|nr:hypothetical protein [Prescottella equi]